MKNINAIDPNISIFINTLNDKGVELMDMFEEYEALDKNSMAAKAIEYYILNGPYTKYMTHRFNETASLEDFLNMVYDIPDCRRPESEFLEDALEILYDEFGIEKNDKGKVVQPENFRLATTTADCIKLSMRTAIPMQIIRDEYMISSPTKDSDVVLTLLRDSNYSYFFYNRALKKYMSEYLPKLFATRRVEFVISEKTFGEDRFYCTLSVIFHPSRANFDTVDELHRLVDYVINEYGAETNKA